MTLYFANFAIIIDKRYTRSINFCIGHVVEKVKQNL